ncbi:MAG TPA: SRPBCC family protein [Solirubrobacteraceae bacterium]|nr:SRPBCC family protein [Solirubrobacteraceae bacterium]
MKELQGWASVELDVPVKACFELLASIESYPDWFEVVSAVEILENERNGTPGLARAELYVPQSPFGTHFELLVEVRTERTGAVTLTRVPDGVSDVDRLELAWRMQSGGSTRLEFEFDAAASFVPSFVPVGGAGDAIARAAIEAARAALGAGLPGGHP